MRILELYLPAYGHFTDVGLELSAGDRGVHLVCGRNELGKSTALRALRSLFFGFPQRLADSFKHPPNKIRIGATVLAEDGEELSFLRRKGRSGTLLSLDGEPLDDALLEGRLGGLGEGLFSNLFALDHQRLVEGGAEILRGDGDLGSSLYAAALGGARLGRLLADLNEAADRLFRPRGTKRALSSALAEYRKLAKDVKESALPPREWKRLRRERDDAKARADELDDRIRRLREEQRKLERIRGALGVLPGLDELQRERDELGDDVPALRKSFVEDCVLALGARAQARAQLDRIVAERRDLAGKLAELDAREDLRLLADSGLRGTLRSAARELVDGRERHAEKLEAHRLAEREIGALVEELGALEEAPDPARLAAILTEAPSDLDHQIDELRAELTSAEREASDALVGLPRFSGTIEALVALKAPPAATVERFTIELSSGESELGRARDRVTSLETEFARHEKRLAKLIRELPIPTTDERDAARRDRDVAWSRIRRRWLAEAAAPEIDGDEPDEALAGRLETETARADTIADGLAEESTRIAERRSCSDEIERVEDELEAARAVLADAEATLRRTRDAWEREWADCKFEPGTPREMESWLRAREEILRLARETGRSRDRLATLETRRQRLLDDLAAQLDALGRTGASWSALATAVSACRDVVRELESARQERRDRTSALKAARAALAEAAEALESIGQRAGAAETRWTETLERAGLDAGTRPEALDAMLDAVEKLQQKRDKLIALDEKCVENAAESAHALEEADATLATLATEAGCAPDELPERRGVIERAADIDEKIRARRDELYRIAEGESLDALRAEIDSIDPQSVAPRLAEMVDELRELENERGEARELAGAKRNEVERLDGGSSAAAAAEAAQSALADARMHAERYAALRVAAKLLEGQIDAYREATEGPVLTRASELFSRLTRGEFKRLRAVYDGDRPVIEAIRRSGEELRVDGMSDGTRDQLFLSLRLACLEEHLKSHPPMPLIVDDLLINFDDSRATATLEVLGELSKKTQVIIFSHHDHVEALARKALSREVLQVPRFLELSELARWKAGRVTA